MLFIFDQRNLKRTKYNTAITYKSSPSFLYILYSVHTFYQFSLVLFEDFFFRFSFFFKRQEEGLCLEYCDSGLWTVYARGSTRGSSSPRDSSSFFSSVLARELRLFWAPIYRVAYTGFVKLVGWRRIKKVHFNHLHMQSQWWLCA